MEWSQQCRAEEGGGSLPTGPRICSQGHRGVTEGVWLTCEPLPAQVLQRDNRPVWAQLALVLRVGTCPS